MIIRGALIAPVTPVDAEGKIELDQFHSLLDFLIEGGIDGVCVGGGTGEYSHFDLEERKTILSEAVAHAGKRIRVLASIGSSSFARTLELGRHAAEKGVEAVLVPPPHFYSYSQGDLGFFYRELSRNLSIPCVIYNLPFFTNPLEEETILSLLKSDSTIIGIKDSSGRPRSLARFREELGSGESSLIIGKDLFILDALETGWDGIISGLGNVCPELIACIYNSYREGDFDQARYCQDQITRISKWLEKFPVPWGVRIGLEVRGLRTGPLAIPPCPERQAELGEFRDWFQSWLKEGLPRLAVLSR